MVHHKRQIEQQCFQVWRFVATKNVPFFSFLTPLPWRKLFVCFFVTLPQVIFCAQARDPSQAEKVEYEVSVVQIAERGAVAAPAVHDST